MTITDDGAGSHVGSGEDAGPRSVIVAAASPFLRAGMVACVGGASGGWRVHRTVADASQLEILSIAPEVVVLATDRIIQCVPGTWAGWPRTLALLDRADPLREAELVRQGLAGVLTLGADEVEVRATLERVLRGELSSARTRRAFSFSGGPGCLALASARS